MKKSQSSYEACLAKMFALHRFGIILGLDTIKNILTALGDPHRSFRCIHIAGTNGKGSIASSLASILKKAGFRTGLYTSPHLVKFNERIQIDGNPIDDESVVRLYELVKEANQGKRGATFFEFATAMAFKEFARRKVDWAVIETGMGGRLDATNIVSPELTIITNIALEHKEYLGNTLAQIASEKGGIIKPDIPVVTGVTQQSVIAVIEDICRRQKSACFRKGKDFRIRRKPEGRFDYFGIHQNIKDLTTGLAGEHQFDNAAIALAACEQLIARGIALPEAVIRNALATHHWAGRLEKVLDRPMVILDGAHNLMAAKVLAQYLQENLKDKTTTLVIGILSDKPYEAILKSLVPTCAKVILTQPKIDRSLPPETLLKTASRIHSKVEIIPDVAEALETAINRSAAEDAVCVAGSLYVVGEAKEALAKRAAGSA